MCGDLVQRRQQVVAVGAHLGKPGQVVDADSGVAQIVRRHTQRARQVIGHVEHAVAQADHIRPGGLADRPADRRHRVAVVEEQRVGREIQHIFGDRHHGRDHAQRARAAARPDRIAHRHEDAVLARDKHILLPRPPPAHAHRADHRRGPAQHLAPIGGGAERHGCLLGGDHFRHQPLGGLKRGRVDIDQRQIGREHLIE